MLLECQSLPSLVRSSVSTASLRHCHSDANGLGTSRRTGSLGRQGRVGGRTGALGLWLPAAVKVPNALAASSSCGVARGKLRPLGPPLLGDTLPHPASNSSGK